jgi:catechol 2,3-dioxygenase-like lactoylglutathione lyase family enzyme
MTNHLQSSLRSTQMNTEIAAHPKLQHFGLTTANLEAMIDWYRKVLGMTVNHRSAAPAGTQKGSSLSAVWLSNDEVNHWLRA